MPLSFLYIYIGMSAGSLSETLGKKGSFWDKAELYYFILSIALLITMIYFIWGMVAKEVSRFEAEFDAAHPDGFDIKKAQRIELQRMEEERKARENPEHAEQAIEGNNGEGQV